MRLPCVFWNIGKRPLQGEVAKLAAQLDAKLVVLAECEIDPDAVISALKTAGLDGFTFPYAPAKDSDVRVFARLPGGCELEPVEDDPNNHVSIRRLILNEAQDLLLVAVHLQSKRNYTEDDQSISSNRLAQRIIECEERAGHRRTIVVGDLNMNPFEKGMVGCDGLHGVMTRRLAAKQSRVVDGRERHFFYNPMWQFFGDRESGPPGTCYFPNSGNTYRLFWNMFDQVLVRPELVSALEIVGIIDRLGDVSLLDEDGYPSPNVGSDHFPIHFSLNLI